MNVVKQRTRIQLASDMEEAEQQAKQGKILFYCIVKHVWDILIL